MTYIVISYADDSEKSVVSALVKLSKHREFIKEYAHDALIEIAKAKNKHKNDLRLLDYRYYGSELELYLT